MAQLTLLPQITPKLRDYQIEVIAQTYDLIRQGSKRILIVSGTGTGKTVIISQVVQHAAVRKGRKVLFVVHRDCLINQTHDKLTSFGIDCGFINADRQENRDALVQIASVQTLARRQWWRDCGFDVVILDEAHQTAWAAVTKRMMTDIYPDAVYLGLTATPWRLDKTEGMGDIFESVVCAPFPRQMIKAGYLSKPDYYSVEGADLSSVKMIGGDFDEGALATACDHPHIIERIVDEWSSKATGRRTIIFAVGIEHSKHISEAFQRRGVLSAHIDGSTPKLERQAIFASLEAGNTLILSSCAAITEGFDSPAVSCVCLCRPTASKALYFQQIGRGLRISPATGKEDCIVLDQAGNVPRHGFVENFRSYSLDCGEAEDPSKKAPTKECPNCGSAVPLSALDCPECGFHFERKGEDKGILLAELIRLLPPEDRDRHEWFQSLAKEGYVRGYSPGWAAHMYKEVHGEYPLKEWSLCAIFGPKPTKTDKQAYRASLEARATKLGKTDWWVKKYYNLEFGK